MLLRRRGVVDMDSFDPFDNIDHVTQECWICGCLFTVDQDYIKQCPVCLGNHLVPFGDRYFVPPEVYHEVS